MSNNNHSNSKKHEHSLRMREEEDRTFFKMKIFDWWLVLIVVIWSCLSHLLTTMGLWEYVGNGSDADTVLSTISLLLPVVGLGVLLGMRQ